MDFLNLIYLTAKQAKPDKLHVTNSHKIIVDSRGGVEDLTFEAKANDSKKKFEAKPKDRLFEGRPSRDQRRTLEAKDRELNFLNYGRQIFYSLSGQKYLR